MIMLIRPPQHEGYIFDPMGSYINDHEGSLYLANYLITTAIMLPLYCDVDTDALLHEPSNIVCMVMEQNILLHEVILD